MQKHKIHIFDQSSHRQALYAYYLEQAGYEVESVNNGLHSRVLLQNGLCYVVSLPDNQKARAKVLKSLSNDRSYKPLFVLDSIAFAHQDFQKLVLVGHVHRNSMSLSETMVQLTHSLSNLLK